MSSVAACLPANIRDVLHAGERRVRSFGLLEMSSGGGPCESRPVPARWHWRLDRFFLERVSEQDESEERSQTAAEIKHFRVFFLYDTEARTAIDHTALHPERDQHKWECCSPKPYCLR